MTLAPDENQGAFFQEAINPSYLSNMTYHNEAEMPYGGFPEGIQLLNNSDLNNTLFADGGSTGFTPPLFTPNGPNPFFNGPSLQSQSYFGSFEEQQSNYFPQATVPPQCTTNIPVTDCNNASQAVDGGQSPSTTLTTTEPRRGTRPKSKKEPLAAGATDAAPPVRKRRARKNKKQLSDEEIRAKRERFLERNRIAASKCRDKKKDWTNKMEEKMRILQADRSLLKELAQTLMEEKRTLTALLHEHSSCNHQGLDAWLKEKATAILSSPDVVASHLSRMESIQSSPTSRPESRCNFEDSGLSYEGSRSNSLDSQQSNVMSPTVPPRSRQSSPEFPHRSGAHFSPGNTVRPHSAHGAFNNMACQHSANSNGHDMDRQNSSNSLSDGGHEHQNYQDSGISDMEIPTKQPSVEGSSSISVPKAMYVAGSSGNVMMANQRLVGRSNHVNPLNSFQTPQFAQG